MLYRVSQNTRFAFVLEPKALAIDVDDNRVVENAIEHRGGKHAVAGEGAIPAAEGQVRCQDLRAAFVALCQHLEEQVGLLAAHRQVADLVKDGATEALDAHTTDLLETTAIAALSALRKRKLTLAAEAGLASQARRLERISEFEAAGVGEIFFCLLTTAPAERIEEMGREIVSRY
jgi:uncharacterized protein YfaT (DUF1175 family)